MIDRSIVPAPPVKVRGTRLELLYRDVLFVRRAPQKDLLLAPRYPVPPPQEARQDDTSVQATDSDAA